ncbi:MAG: hypothetical protein AAFR64_07580 [Pseudomonadota bacterium]
MKFDMNAIWSRAVELVQENLQLLAIVSAVFLLLPSVAIYLLLPSMQTFADPAADPDVVAAQLQANLGPIITFGVVSMLVQFAGNGAMIALMSGARLTVGEAIKTGLKITLSALAVFVIFMLCYFFAAIIVIIPFALLGGLTGLPALGALGVLPALLASAYIAARMSMSMPVMVLENTLNPIGAVLRSFALTRKRHWSILMFWAVLFLCYFVIAILLSSVISLIAALAGGGTVSALILGLTNGLMGMIIGMLMCGIAVAMYGQLSITDEDVIGSVFD